MKYSWVYSMLQRIIHVASPTMARWIMAVAVSVPSLAFSDNTLNTPARIVSAPGQIVVSGTVPDEATKSVVLEKLRQLYGAGRVVDQISTGNVVASPNWSTHVQKLLAPHLKLISKGQLMIDGTNVSLKGEVANEALRQQIASDMAVSLNPTYVIKNGLRVSAVEQRVLNQVLANRIVEFEAGSARLTSSGTAILDEMAAAMTRIGNKHIEIIGHTDSSGQHDTNMALSQARADAVKTHLIAAGINPALLNTSGMGPDQPIASNDTAAGRSRNRRIEFRVSQ